MFLDNQTNIFLQHTGFYCSLQCKYWFGFFGFLFGFSAWNLSFCVPFRGGDESRCPFHPGSGAKLPRSRRAEQKWRPAWPPALKPLNTAIFHLHGDNCGDMKNTPNAPNADPKWPRLFSLLPLIRGNLATEPGRPINTKFIIQFARLSFLHCAVIISLVSAKRTNFPHIINTSLSEDDRLKHGKYETAFVHWVIFSNGKKK